MSDPVSTIFDDILDLALARDATRRSTLVRVLVDGFVRDEGPRNALERRQFAELMTNLLAEADPFTRAVVAQKLASRTDAPESVIVQLATDHEAIAEPVLTHSPLLAADLIDQLIAEGEEATRQALALRADLTPAQAKRLGVAPRQEAPAPAPTPRQEAPAAAPVAAPAAPPPFLTLPGPKRREMLAKLTAARIEARIGAAPAEVVKALTRHAILRRREDFLDTLGNLLGLPRAEARAIVEDMGGEPFVVAARVLDLSEDLMAQLLALVAPALGEDYDTITDLRALHRATSREASAAIVASWRHEAKAKAPRHQPVQAAPRAGVERVETRAPERVDEGNGTARSA